MGVFLLFPLAAFAGLMVAGRAARRRRPTARCFERTALVARGDAAALCALPRRGAGLRRAPVAAVRIPVPHRRRAPRGRDLRAATGSRCTRLARAATLLVMAMWLAMLVRAIAARGLRRRRLHDALRRVLSSRRRSLPRRSARAVPRRARRRRRTTPAPLLLSAFPVLAAHRARIRGAVAARGCAPRARRPHRLAGDATAQRGSLYFIAAFFAIATQAVWSAEHLTLERLGTAVIIYALFGLVSLGCSGRRPPRRARRSSRRGAAAPC